MTVDYKAIAEAIPKAEMDAALAVMSGGKFFSFNEINAAYDAIEPLDESVSKGIHKQTYISLAADIGFSDATEFSTAIATAIGNASLPAWVNDAMNGDGINVNDSDVSGVLAILVANFGLSQSVSDAILATGSHSVPKFKNLKRGHVQTAIALRAGGQI